MRKKCIPLKIASQLFGQTNANSQGLGKFEEVGTGIIDGLIPLCATAQGDIFG